MPWWLVQKVAADFVANGIRVTLAARDRRTPALPPARRGHRSFPGCAVSDQRHDARRRITGRELLATCFERIRLCVDTVNPEVYPMIRRGGRCDEVVANIRGFLELSNGTRRSESRSRSMISLRPRTRPSADFERLLRARSLPAGDGHREDLRGPRHHRRDRAPRAVLRLLPGLPIPLVRGARRRSGDPLLLRL